MANIYCIKKANEVEQYIEKSRFIAYTKPVLMQIEAEEFIKKIRSLHKKANHNVYAYVIGDEFELQKSSDDGEPGGSAGMPILNILKQESLTNLIVVVTRYFGGIKLGTGGLARAYSGTAKLGLEISEITAKTLKNLYQIIIDYSHLDNVKHLIQRLGEIHDITYNIDVSLFFYLEELYVTELEAKLSNYLSSSISFIYIRSEYI